MSRTFLYIGVWVAIVSAALIIRFTILAGSDTETRIPLAIGLMVIWFVLLAVGNMYESRKLALAAGLRGQRALGYLRGWVKATSVDLAVDGLQHVPKEAERQFLALRIASAYVFASLIVIVPILVF